PSHPPHVIPPCDDPLIRSGPRAPITHGVPGDGGPHGLVTRQRRVPASSRVTAKSADCDPCSALHAARPVGVLGLPKGPRLASIASPAVPRAASWAFRVAVPSPWGLVSPSGQPHC